MLCLMTFRMSIRHRRSFTTALRRRGREGRHTASRWRLRWVLLESWFCRWFLSWRWCSWGQKLRHRFEAFSRERSVWIWRCILWYLWRNREHTFEGDDGNDEVAFLFPIWEKFIIYTTLDTTRGAYLVEHWRVRFVGGWRSNNRDLICLQSKDRFSIYFLVIHSIDGQ